MDINFKKISTKAGKKPETPKCQTNGSACFDLVANIDEQITIKSGETLKVPTGIAIEIPSNNYVALVFARSGLALNGIALSNSVGVIDSDYRGEILVSLINNGSEDYIINIDERIAQLGIFPVIMANLCEKDELNETKRGSGGFGSTGR